MKIGIEFLNIIFVNLFPVIKNDHILIWCVKNTHTHSRTHRGYPPQKKVEIKVYAADGST
jgi:hypothetical protein